MNKNNRFELRKNEIWVELNHEPSIDTNTHWLNPLLLKHKSKILSLA